MGFSYQYPLLYPPLVKHCFALPPDQKRRQGQHRLLMWRYLAKHIPSGLFNNHKKCGPDNPIYQKPKTSLFLEKPADIQSGANNVLESQGDGFLTS